MFKCKSCQIYAEEIVVEKQLRPYPHITVIGLFGTKCPMCKSEDIPIPNLEGLYELAEKINTPARVYYTFDELRGHVWRVKR